MKIVRARCWSEDLELTRPYTIAYATFDQVRNVFVCLEAEDGTRGWGAGSPAAKITGEALDTSQSALENHLEEIAVGQDLRKLGRHLRRCEDLLAATPAARAAADIAFHDLYARHLGLPLVEILGRVHVRLQTSITLGIQNEQETLEEAREYVDRGFRILKLKTGVGVEQDLAILKALRAEIGNEVKIRVDANQGYDLRQLRDFATAVESLDVELVEQPLPAKQTDQLRGEPQALRRRCAADESLHTPEHALELSARPWPFGIFNIKLMKCGGIGPALRIADLAHLAGIELMWGCMDESEISISAALHAAFACPASRYLDLDGSLDLARDVAKGGFLIEDGWMRTTDQPGLGVSPLED